MPEISAGFACRRGRTRPAALNPRPPRQLPRRSGRCPGPGTGRILAPCAAGSRSSAPPCWPRLAAGVQAQPQPGPTARCSQPGAVCPHAAGSRKPHADPCQGHQERRRHRPRLRRRPHSDHRAPRSTARAASASTSTRNASPRPTPTRAAKTASRIWSPSSSRTRYDRRVDGDGRDHLPAHAPRT